MLLVREHSGYGETAAVAAGRGSVAEWRSGLVASAPLLLLQKDPLFVVVKTVLPMETVASASALVLAASDVASSQSHVALARVLVALV